MISKFKTVKDTGQFNNIIVKYIYAFDFDPYTFPCFIFVFDNKKNDLKFSGYSNNCKYYWNLICEFENDLETNDNFSMNKPN